MLNKRNSQHRRQSWGFGSVTAPGFWEVVEPTWNIIFYNLQEYEVRTLSKSGDSAEIERFVYNWIKIPGIIPSILCYVPSSVDFLGPTTPPCSQTRTHDTPVFKPDWCLWFPESGRFIIIIIIRFPVYRKLKLYVHGLQIKPQTPSLLTYEYKRKLALESYTRLAFHISRNSYLATIWSKIITLELQDWLNQPISVPDNKLVPWTWILSGASEV